MAPGNLRVFSTPKSPYASGEKVPQGRLSGAKAPIYFSSFTARLKSCPDTKPKLSVANRMSRFKSWTHPNIQNQKRLFGDFPALLARWQATQNPVFKGTPPKAHDTQGCITFELRTIRPETFRSR
jgi:hypothetical protein